MSNPVSAGIVDLTGEDDDDSLTEVLGLDDENPVDGNDTREQSHIPEPFVRQRRAPGHLGGSRPTSTQPSRNRSQNVIDLSDDEDIPDNPFPEAHRQPEMRRGSTSSDIVFVGERVATPPTNPALNNHRPSVRDRRPTPGPYRERRLPRDVNVPPLPMGGLGGFPDFFRRTTQTLFALAPPFLQPNPNEIPEPMLNDDLEIVEFNYGQAAFPMGDRGSETPQATPGSAYKEPPPVPEGFAGDIEEDGVYMCPRCDEELATGDTEEKQQVWVAKQCGHVSSFPSHIVLWLTLVGVLRWLCTCPSAQVRYQEGEEAERCRCIQDVCCRRMRREGR